MADNIVNDQQSDDSYEEYDNSDELCGTDNTTCDCFDCKVYFNKITKRPIKTDNITDELFNELLTLCQKENVIERMKTERYRSNIYQITPYPMWKQLQDPEKYQAVVDKLKAANLIPDELPEICFIGSATETGLDDVTREINTVLYRFPTSTVKYELLVYKEDDHYRIKTRATGSEYQKN